MIGSGILSKLSTVAKTGQYNDILNKPDLSPVATTGAYSDLVDAPARLTGTASGTSPLAVQDAEAGKPLWFTVFGKTSISGTPSPGKPASIRGAGVGNDCYIKITGGGTSKTYYTGTDFYIHDLPNGVSDKITCKNGIWGIERNVAQLTLTGTEVWQLNGSLDGRTRFALYDGRTVGSTAANAFRCTHYTYSADANGQNNFYYVGGSWVTITPNDVLNIADNDTGDQKLAKYKAWLAQNPVTIYYQRKNPTWTPFSSSAQTVLNSMVLYAGDNTVEFSTAPGKPNAGIEVKYYRDIDAVVNGFAPVATSGNYNDLIDKPDIPPRLTGTASGTGSLTVTESDAGKPINLTVWGDLTVTGTPSPDTPATLTGIGSPNNHITITGESNNKSYGLEAFNIYGLPGITPDRLYKKDGVWGIERNIAQLTLKGTEEWLKGNTSLDTDALISFYCKPDNAKFEGVCMCSRFPVVKNPLLAQEFAHMSGSTANMTGSFFIKIDRSRLATQDVAGFKAWLVQNPIVLIYELKEPTWMPLISQSQNSLNSMELYAGNNTISFAMGGAPEMEIVYNRDINAVIARLEAALAAQ